MVIQQFNMAQKSPVNVVCKNTSFQITWMPQSLMPDWSIVAAHFYANLSMLAWGTSILERWMIGNITCVDFFFCQLNIKILAYIKLVGKCSSVAWVGVQCSCWIELARRHTSLVSLTCSSLLFQQRMMILKPSMQNSSFQQGQILNVTPSTQLMILILKALRTLIL